jgi:hypothetical protein
MNVPGNEALIISLPFTKPLKMGKYLDGVVYLVGPNKRLYTIENFTRKCQFFPIDLLVKSK